MNLSDPESRKDAGDRLRRVPNRRKNLAGIEFALLGHPTILIVRFLSKACLVWFLSREELGLAMFAGLFVFLGQNAALVGMDDAVIQSPRLSRPLWRRMRRVHHGTGLFLALAVAVVGHALASLLGEPLLARLTLVLAPVVWIANLSVLPTALLLRERSFRSVFLVDLASVIGLATATVGAAAAGMGAWSLVIGWYVNALTAAVVASVLARGALARLSPVAGDKDGDALRFGAQMSGASVVGFAGERVDSLAVGAGLGPAALGLYEWSLHIAQCGLGYANSLAERCLFPILSEERRSGALRDGHRAALRLCLLCLLPLHLVFALVAKPLVTTIFPSEWHAAAPLVGLFALGAGVRCFEIVGITTLKALGRAGTVLRLAGARLAFVGAALALTLHTGSLEEVAIGLLLARIAGAALTLALVAREPELAVDVGSTRGEPA